jgi:SAM-dependent methyltransferase
VNSVTASERHSNYDHYSVGTARRLDGPFGVVEASFAALIAPWVAGKRVLDIGCGFGSLVDNLRSRGFDAVGIDQLGEFIEVGRSRYPAADLRAVPNGSLPFPDKSFDTIVLKDTIHHIYEEGDLLGFLADAKRVCRERIIVVDPNPTIVLRMSRKLIGHVDPVCAPEAAREALERTGFRIIRTEFHELLAFPLSGGYVGKPMITRGLAPGLVWFDRLLLNALRPLGADRHVCWRYMLVGSVA